MQSSHIYDMEDEAKVVSWEEIDDDDDVDDDATRKQKTDFVYFIGNELSLS